MKVLQVLPDLSAGGAEGFAVHLGLGLAELGVEVRFFLMAGARGARGQRLLECLRQKELAVVGAEEHNVRSPANILRLTTALRSWRPDIVHAHLYPAEVLVTLVRALSLGCRASCVRTLHSTEICGYRSRRVVRLLDSWFRQTVACSPAVAKAYHAFIGPKGRSELITIPNGAQMQEAVTTPEERRHARRTLGIPADAFVVAHIGRMLGGAVGIGLGSEPKAQDVLLKAFAAAFQHVPTCMLVLVGDGPLRPEVEQLARTLGIAEQTCFLGHQPEPWPALRAADMFCLPSRHEGLPLVLLEAASCGLPVLASDIPEIRSLFPDGAWLLKPVDDVQAIAEGLRAVFEGPDAFVRRAREAACAFREKSSMRRCAQEYLQAYEATFNRCVPGFVC